MNLAQIVDSHQRNPPKRSFEPDQLPLSPPPQENSRQLPSISSMLMGSPPSVSDDLSLDHTNSGYNLYHAIAHRSAEETCPCGPAANDLTAERQRSSFVDQWRQNPAPTPFMKDDDYRCCSSSVCPDNHPHYYRQPSRQLAAPDRHVPISPPTPPSPYTAMRSGYERGLSMSMSHHQAAPMSAYPMMDRSPADQQVYKTIDDYYYGKPPSAERAPSMAAPATGTTSVPMSLVPPYSGLPCPNGVPSSQILTPRSSESPVFDHPVYSNNVATSTPSTASPMISSYRSSSAMMQRERDAAMSGLGITLGDERSSAIPMSSPDPRRCPSLPASVPSFNFTASTSSPPYPGSTMSSSTSSSSPYYHSSSSSLSPWQHQGQQFGHSHNHAQHSQHSSASTPPPPPTSSLSTAASANTATSPTNASPAASTPLFGAMAFPHNHLDRYVCCTCHKAFSRPSSLRIHSHSHTGEKPYRCSNTGCGKAFSVRSNMKRHERGCHHGPGSSHGQPLTSGLAGN